MLSQGNNENPSKIKDIPDIKIRYKSIIRYKHELDDGNIISTK